MFFICVQENTFLCSCSWANVCHLGGKLSDVSQANRVTQKG